MRYRRLVPALAVLLAVSPPLAAQNETFLFSTSTADSVDIEKFEGKSNFTVRPNTARELNLFVRNDVDDLRDLHVDLLDAKGKVAATATVAALKKTYARVKFAKPMAPMPAPAAPPIPAPPMPMPMGPPLPPGTEIEQIKSGDFEFKIRVYEDKVIDAELKKAQAKPETKNITRNEIIAQVKPESVIVSVSDPTTYIKLVGRPQYRKVGGDSLLEITVEADKDAFSGPPCVVEMSFPPQPNLDVTALGAGVSRVTLTEPGQKAKLYTTGLPIRTVGVVESALETVNLHIDGVPRVYTFRQNLRLEKLKLTDIVETATPAIRLIEDGKTQSPDAFASLPKERFPFRVEVEGSTSGFEVKLTEPNGQEVTKLTRSTAYHARVWIDPFGEGGAFHVESRKGDWVVPLDTRAMRGTFTLTATLTQEAKSESFTRRFVVDDTPPPVDRINLEGIPNKQYRGRPMVLTISASDPESSITKVAAFFGKPAPDGKLPEPPALVQAIPGPKGAGWVVELQVPADKKGGPESITMVATNEVGLSTAKTINIQLLDPPLGGTIKGIVKLGEFGKEQEGVTVILKGDDGKDKDTTKTKKGGAFEFTDVLPGTYVVAASRPDSAFGTKGEVTVRVKKPGDIAVAEPIILTRKP